MQDNTLLYPSSFTFTHFRSGEHWHVCLLLLIGMFLLEFHGLKLFLWDFYLIYSLDFYLFSWRPMFLEIQSMVRYCLF